MADSTILTYEKGKLYDLSIAQVQPDPDQTRKYLDEGALGVFDSENCHLDKF